MNASKLNTGGRFHETVTQFFTHLIHLSFEQQDHQRDVFPIQHEPDEDFDAFMKRTERVFGDWKMIYTYYSKEQLDGGRAYFKEPDLKPMPVSWSELVSRGNGDKKT